MNWLQRWIKNTSDYNPTFPLSALFLLLGLTLLSGEGSLANTDWTGPAIGLSIFQGYEFTLLAVLLCVLWPRKIIYESTSILIIFSIVRYAAPFFVISTAGDGQLSSSLIFGAILFVFMSIKNELILKQIGLAHKGWEKYYDLCLFAFSAILFPVLAYTLTKTGDGLSFQSARALQGLSWWLLALSLIPLTFGLTDLGEEQPLQSRRAAVLWRCLKFAAMPLLLGNALWVGGELPQWFGILPLGLTGFALFVCISRLWGRDQQAYDAFIPAVFIAIITVLPESVLMGPAPFISKTTTLFIFAAFAAASLFIVAPKEKKSGFIALSLVSIVLFPPLHFATAFAYQAYFLGISVIAVGYGLLVKSEKIFLAGAALTMFIASTLISSDHNRTVLSTFLIMNSAFSLSIAWRKLSGLSFYANYCFGLILLTASTMTGDIDQVLVLVSVASSASLSMLAWRFDQKSLSRIGSVTCIPLILRQCGPSLARVNPGLVFIGLAFAAIPLGVYIAIKREAKPHDSEAVEIECPIGEN
jgi:hypothetical protein